MRWSSAQRYRTSNAETTDAPFLLCRWLGILEGFSYGAGGFLMLAIFQLPIHAREGRPPETLDCLSHDTGRMDLYLLPRQPVRRRRRHFSAAWTSVFLADVRSSLRPAFRSLPPYRAGLSRLRTQRLARTSEKSIAYTISKYTIRRQIMNHFTEALGLSRYTLYMQDYGGPVGFRMVLVHPDRIRGAHCSERRCAQRRVLGAIWKTAPGRLGRSRRQRGCAFAQNLLSLATTPGRAAT